MGTEQYTLPAGTKICQILAYDGMNFEVELVDSLPPSKRGEKGFGSSGAAAPANSTNSPVARETIERPAIDFFRDSEIVNGERILTLTVAENDFSCANERLRNRSVEHFGDWVSHRTEIYNANSKTHYKHQSASDKEKLFGALQPCSADEKDCFLSERRSCFESDLFHQMSTSTSLSQFRSICSGLVALF